MNTPTLTRRGFFFGSAAIVLTPGLLMRVDPKIVEPVQLLYDLKGGRFIPFTSGDKVLSSGDSLCVRDVQVSYDGARMRSENSVTFAINAAMIVKGAVVLVRDGVHVLRLVREDRRGRLCVESIEKIVTLGQTPIDNGLLRTARLNGVK